jgi:2-oxo-4-hydroxy-4-carboxy--5-ureidoimidazoline (OHCU) decarboxylase
MDTRTRRAAMPSVPELDRLPPDAFVSTMGPLFEGASAFLARLEAERPFGSPGELFRRAREVALAMPADEQVELVDAHPRLGAPAGSVSPLSFVEQGYDREAADAAAEAERQEIDARLDRLNVAYERRFGFRFCVFVAGRPRAGLLPIFESALLSERSSELRRAVGAAIDIADDRYRRLRGEDERQA